MSVTKQVKTQEFCRSCTPFATKRAAPALREGRVGSPAKVPKEHLASTFCNEMMPRRTLPAHTFALVYNMTTYPAPKLAQPRQSQETT